MMSAGRTFEFAEPVLVMLRSVLPGVDTVLFEKLMESLTRHSSLNSRL